jgi:hypothetical protein
MALIIALIVAVGFGPTADRLVIHPALPRPRILYVHIAVFTGWTLLFLAQAALVVSRRIAWHRRLGLCGIVLGALVPVLGISTVLVIKRLEIARDHAGNDAALIVPFFDMLAFTVAFSLAIYWRKRPEIHRRLMLVASCGLTVAAFARFPSWLIPHNAFYVGVDALIFVGAARDRIVLGRVHPVYLYGLPTLVLGQATTMWIFLRGAPAWSSLVHKLQQ